MMKTVMNQLPSTGPSWHPPQCAAYEPPTSPPAASWWRRACTSLSLAALTLVGVNASAQNWIDTDLGGPTYAGYTQTNNDGSLDVFGGGSDIWNTTSGCHYRYAWASGTNWDMVIQVKNFAGVDPTWSKVVLMVDWANTTTGPQGNDAFIAALNTLPTGDNEFGVDQFRTTSGGSADWTQEGTSPRPVYPLVWMKMHRSGSIFSIYYSTNGAAWTDYIDIDTSKTTTVGGGGTTFGTAWPDLVCVGIAVTAHNDTGGLADATVANISSTFGSITPPKVVLPTTQVANGSAYVGSEATFSFVTTNDANPNVVLPSYQWYKNGLAVSNATGTSFTWLATAADNGAQVYCTATVPPPYNTSVAMVKSATGTLSVASSVIVTNGWKTMIYSANGGNSFSYVQAVESGNTAPATTKFVQSSGDNPGGYGNNYVSRTSGFFIPPTTDHYVFFVDVDDNADLLLNTNTANGTDPAGKSVIAQQNLWAPLDAWLGTDSNNVAGGGNPPDYTQNNSQSFTTNGVQPGLNGYLLNAGQLYYMEVVHSQGGGGDNFGVTYETLAQFNAGTLTNGHPSALNVTNNNMAFMSYPDTTPTWTLQPTNVTATAGTGAGFSAAAVDGGEFAPLYQWYSNNVPVVGATGASLFYGSTPASAQGAQYYCVATGIMNGLSSTSSVATMNVASGVLEKGWVKVEWWYGRGLAALEAGTLPPSTNVITSPTFEADSTGSSGNNYANRLTTLFYPPTSGNYVFFDNSDDQSDLFVSTDKTPGNKQLCAQETGWSNPWQWSAPGGGGSTAAQKRSDQWLTNGVAPFANGFPMVAGQAYYIEVDHQDTGGGENAEVTYKLTSDPDPANGAHSKLIGANIAMTVPRSFYVGFTQQPTNVTAPVFGQATFSVAGATDSQVAVGGTGNDRSLWNNRIAYQWSKNGTPIPGATSSSYSILVVSPADNGAQFSCAILSLGYVDNGGNDIWSNSVTATLTVAGGQVLETGYALHQMYRGNPGRASVEAGTAGTPLWIMSTPAFEADITGTEVADNFCDDLIGYFVPQTSGNYVFFCNSDDDADLFLSTDASFTDERLIAQQTSYGAGALNWQSTLNGTASQVRSDTFVDASGATPFANGIALVAGQQYAMEIVHHQGGGGTYSCVTALLTTDPAYPTGPDTGTLSTIRGTAVASYFPRCTYVNITNQPLSQTVNNYNSATFSVTAGTDSTTPIGPEGDWRNSYNNFLTYQWYKNNVAVLGANSATFTIPQVLPSDNNAPIYCEVRALGYANPAGTPIWASSSTAILTVETNAPTMYAAYYANTNAVSFGGTLTNYVVVGFSAPMGPVALLSQASTYTLPAGWTIVSIVVNSNDYKSVALGVTGSGSFPINVQVSSALSAAGGGLPLTSTTAAANPTELMDSDIGTPGSDPAVPGMMYVEGPNAYTISTEGSDIWGNADGFNFAYELKTNDFDVVVRVKNNMHTSNWAKGGLMVREDLSAGSRNWNIVNDPASADGINAPDGSGFGANAVECNTRNTTAGTSGGWDFNARPVPQYPNAWVRLTRVGGLLSAYVSTDGMNWTLQATNTPALVGGLTPLPATVYVGICTTAHNNDLLGASPLLYLNTVSYDNYNSSYVYAPAIKVNAAVSGNQITVTWAPAVGTLQSSPTPNGPWQNVTGVTTPGSYTITLPTANSGLFFRVAN